MIAQAIVYLGDHGHPGVLDYTPRRTMNLYTLAMMNRRQEQREHFRLLSVAARGDKEAVDALLADMRD